MAKRQKQSDGTEIDDVDAEEQVDVGAEVSKVDELAQTEVAPPSLDGLVKMTRDSKIIHAHPTAVNEHIKNGWKPV